MPAEPTTPRAVYPCRAGSASACHCRVGRALMLLLAAALVSATHAAPPADDERLTVILAGKVITNTGKDVDDAVIVVSGGKITNVGRGLEYPLNAAVIDARDRVVMPGLINPQTRFGLSGYSRGEVHGNWSAADEYFPAPHEYDELLEAGYTAIALAPAGGGIPGRAIVVRTGGPAQQRVLKSPSYLRVTPDKRVFRGALEKAKQEIEKVEKAREEFEKKQKQEAEKPKQEPERKPGDKKAPPEPEMAGAPPAPSEAAPAEPLAAPAPPASQPVTQPASQPATQPAPQFQPPPIDPAHQVLVDLIQKQPDIFALLELGSASDYVHYQDVLAKFDVARRYLARLSFESDLEYVADKLGAEKAQIVLTPLVTRVPNSLERLNVVRRLADAGCVVSLMPVNDSAVEHQRVLDRTAGLVKAGWSRSDALKALTLHPARLLGLDHRLGTIEAGRDADLILLDGDPLDPLTRVREVLIAGEMVYRSRQPDGASPVAEGPR